MRLLGIVTHPRLHVVFEGVNLYQPLPNNQHDIAPDFFGLEDDSLTPLRVKFGLISQGLFLSLLDLLVSKRVLSDLV